MSATDVDRRRQQQRAFMQTLDDEELEEIATAPDWYKLGPYFARGLQFGVDIRSRERLDYLAEQEQQRRRRERQAEAKEEQSSAEFEPFRVVRR
ncbi:hypothetical protein [Haloplanus halophilus]|uniref:hypothetical protein n=1 Tax=Haloplanus halophilus TaxID=2949993 RepID=UPI00203CE306|nr:hypothetical protein [Haloplanus sp. GDY1]